MKRNFCAPLANIDSFFCPGLEFADILSYTSRMPRDEYFLTSLFYDWFVEPHLRGVKVSITDICAGRNAEQVLDICCGTGTQCSLLANKTIWCCGIDLSPGMLKIANKKSSRMAYFMRANSTKLPFKSATFDVAIISFALHEKNLQAREAIAGEAKRVVRTGGIILVADYLTSYPDNKTDWKISLVEFMAGVDHFRCFRDFCSRGGLEGVKSLFGLPGMITRTFGNGSWGILELHVTADK